MLRKIFQQRSFAPARIDELLSHASAADQEIVNRAIRYSMTGTARMLATVDAVRYCVRRGVHGSFVECGVWRGGSVLAMILTLQDEGVDERDIYLYDTFEGMTRPTEADVSADEGKAMLAWADAERDGQRAWPDVFGRNVFSEEGVRALLESTGYPSERLHFVRGPVEQTIPGVVPDQVAILRLDTDWYESTRHELAHLFPRLEPSGVLIVDDYGHWQGAQLAVDEYFQTAHPPLLLSRIDYTGRIAVKP
jgi:O-methyltransferase